VLGIIGRNGAGKSTLLKILSRVTEPTTGRVTMNGRVASLLEVGTGFHPELTGRENVYLNGAILGMTRREIDRKFHEIVDFAGVERYIDTPVKRYSSGMHVRLGFAVAAYLDPEILIVDEVLAVGDAEFQKRCLGKMKDVSSNEGRTVLFVSHDMRSIARLCEMAITLSNGQITSKGKADLVIQEYQMTMSEIRKSTKTLSNGYTILNQFIINNLSNLELYSIRFGSEVRIKFSLDCKMSYKSIALAICFDDQSGNRVLSCWTAYQGIYHSLKEGENKFEFLIPKIHLVPGHYNLVLYANWQSETILRVDNICEIVISYQNVDNTHIIPYPSLGNYVEDFECINLEERSV
jgi:lipopolysaccharide transport system ATP-binding protein